MSTSRHAALLISMLFLLCTACQKESTDEKVTTSQIRLELLPSETTGIDFANTIRDEGRINIFTWHFIYNGAGVAAGDINQDGLPDLYFTGNQVSDRLYLNKGNFTFEDITEKAGIVSSTWSSGVTMADVNADGLPDIYVCRNSPTGNPENNRNKLYINQGNLTFKEEAAVYGIDDIGFSTQSTFFDADQDGDLDMYLVNQPFDEFAKLVNPPEVVAQYPSTDRFYFFENGKYIDKTAELGLTNMRYGLNATVGDFDFNGWPDLYVCNDYHHGDHLYLNDRGRFTESIHTHTGHTSFYSMGSDVGDVNNDGWPDLVSLDMAYEDHYRSKTNMGSMDVKWFWDLVTQGHHLQYMQNVLLVNQGNGYFSDMAQIAGMSKSDWSFASLFVDLNHDAHQDLLVSNGVYRDMRNNDFNMMVRERYQNKVGPDNYLDVLKSLPSTPILNILYQNEGDGRFAKLPPEAGFAQNGFSHGMVYADLNADGLQDVVINNQNAVATIYKNTTSTNGHYLNIRLNGPGSNTNGLGCTVVVCHDGTRHVNTMQTTRGYFSAVEPTLHFGLGAAEKVDSVLVYWDHTSMSVLEKIKTNQTITLSYDKEKKVPFRRPGVRGVFVTAENPMAFTHRENPFDDYAAQVLLPYKLSQNGPFAAVADINGDGLEDCFIGGGAGQSAEVFQQMPNGGFARAMASQFATQKKSDDMESVFFDLDADGDQDLLVVSGSNECPDDHASHIPQLYINTGEGYFTRASPSLYPQDPVNGQCVLAFDFDHDQDTDIFIGGRLHAGQYAKPCDGYLWRNENGTLRTAARIENLGMITDAVSGDIDQDHDPDIILTGEWMTPVLLTNDGNGTFTTSLLEDIGSGLWWTIDIADVDQDGDPDLLLGNLGWNNKFGGSRGTKLEVFANDFDQSGDYDVVLASQKGGQMLPVRGRECTSQEMPFILDKFPTYEAYVKAQISEIYPKEKLEASQHHKLNTMSSVIARNNGKGAWSVEEMPLLCQAGPVKAIHAEDFNGDGFMDFMYAGNHFPTEVETARYDGLMAGICFGNADRQFTATTLFLDQKPIMADIRDIARIDRGSLPALYVLTVNDGKAISFSIPSHSISHKETTR